MRVGLPLVFTVVGGAAHAAATGAGVGIEAGFAEIGNDLDTLLGGAGGFLVIVVSIIFAAVMLAIGRGWGFAVTAFAVALFLGYGVNALQGISGVTASVEMLALDTSEAPTSPSERNLALLIADQHSQTSAL